MGKQTMPFAAAIFVPLARPQPPSTYNRRFN
jgi:hypothetical protein